MFFQAFAAKTNICHSMANACFFLKLLFDNFRISDFKIWNSNIWFLVFAILEFQISEQFANVCLFWNTFAGDSNQVSKILIYYLQLKCLLIMFDGSFRSRRETNLLGGLIMQNILTKTSQKYKIIKRRIVQVIIIHVLCH